MVRVAVITPFSQMGRQKRGNFWSPIKFSELCYHKQRDLVYLLKLQLITHVSKFYIPEHRMDTIPIEASVKEKKLTEDSLLDAVTNIMKGAQIVLWMFEWKLGAVDLGVAS